MSKPRLALLGACAAAALSMISGAAQATPIPIDPDKVQALAIQLESALSAGGCSASAGQDVSTVQSTIASSGVSPSEAQAALEVAQSSPGLCPNALVAVATVDKQIELALAGSAAAAGGGPGGGAPIGSPPAYVSGGGSNYQTP